MWFSVLHKPPIRRIKFSLFSFHSPCKNGYPWVIFLRCFVLQTLNKQKRGRWLLLIEWERTVEVYFAIPGVMFEFRLCKSNDGTYLCIRICILHALTQRGLVDEPDDGSAVQWRIQKFWRGRSLVKCGMRNLDSNSRSENRVTLIAESVESAESAESNRPQCSTLIIAEKVQFVSLL